jgi:hypothetical protein
MTERSEGVGWLGRLIGQGDAERSEGSVVTERSEGVGWLGRLIGQGDAERSEGSA